MYYFLLLSLWFNFGREEIFNNHLDIYYFVAKLQFANAMHYRLLWRFWVSGILTSLSTVFSCIEAAVITVYFSTFCAVSIRGRLIFKSGFNFFGINVLGFTRTVYRSTLPLIQQLRSRLRKALYKITRGSGSNKNSIYWNDSSIIDGDDKNNHRRSGWSKTCSVWIAFVACL